jgi:hypothetical protein
LQVTGCYYYPPAMTSCCNLVRRACCCNLVRHACCCCSPRRNSFVSDDYTLPPIRQRTKFTNSCFRRTNFNQESYANLKLPPISRENTTLFKIKYEIHDGFTSAVETTIERAFRVVNNRFFKPEILRNMYDICGTSNALLGPGVWKCSQLETNEIYNGEYDLLRYQMMCLRVKARKGEFPTIHIYPFYEETSVSGQGALGCVSCISYGSKFLINGEFAVKLNQYSFDASTKNGWDPEAWAGTIVHEMLHNLGHDHALSDYSDNWQINVFKKCFIHDGYYNPWN